MTSPMKNLPFKEELDTAMTAADAAKEILMSYFGNLSEVSEKFQAGLVTEADKASEDKIVGILKNKFADHLILGEETGLSSGEDWSTKNYDQDHVWMIDPLDGTTNYVHQFPVFCISIALQAKGELVVALVDAPFLNQRFYAVKGGGAYLNAKPLSVSPRKSWNQYLLATGFSVSKKEEIDQQIEIFRQFLHQTRGVRRAGAAAYDLCLVAQGVIDGFWEKNLSPWDTAAGTLLVREAGGVVTNYKNNFYSPLMSDIVASSPQSHEKLLSVISSV